MSHHGEYTRPLRVSYHRDGDFHAFTSDDVPGLTVSCRALTDAVRDVARGAERLMRVNLDRIVEVKERDVLAVVERHQGEAAFEFVLPVAGTEQPAAPRPIKAKSAVLEAV
ncbi:MAG: hypothetical protein HQL40_14485 [Alphaproteobacteria bacterium]|nr:hypothetical protein [Alphaproteobacteria bacterium]